MSVKKPVLIATRFCGPDRAALAADNAGYTLDKGTYPNFIVVFQLDEETGPYASTYTLQFKKGSGGYGNINSTGEMNYAATTNLTNGGTVTTKLCTAAGASGSAWQDGFEVEGAATSSSLNLADEMYSEIHFAVNCASAVEGATFQFQIFENTGGTAVGATGVLTIASDQPSVVLNTTDAYDFGADTTPTLEFTGTDASDSDIRYNVQISDGSFDNFVDQGVATKNWYDISVNSSNGDVWACVTNGSIWKDTGGDGDFVDQVSGNKSWFGISVNSSNGDVWACVYGGSIWKNAGGTGSFVDQVSGNKSWYGNDYNTEMTLQTKSIL
jgi:hypothetical protein